MRKFNRFYTYEIGVLGEGLADSQLSLTEARILYELAHLDPCTGTALSQALALDPGYVSRILQSVERKKLLSKKPPTQGRRQTLLTLAAAGKRLSPCLIAERGGFGKDADTTVFAGAPAPRRRYE